MTELPDGIRERLHGIAPVDDQAIARLARYVAILKEWQQTLNLISPSTLEEIWQRHIVDCWQLHPIAQDCATAGPVVDLGSGAGLPGMVMAIAGWQPMSLVEANARKAAFLRAASQAVGVPVSVYPVRIEGLSPTMIEPPAVLTARALASLDRLMQLALPIVAPTTVMILPKGRTWRQEVEAAERRYRFAFDALPSVTSDESAIIVVRNIERR